MSRGGEKHKLGDALKAHGVRHFFMVAAIEGNDEPPLTDEQQAELQPHKRHPTHPEALGVANIMARKHNRPFVVLGIKGFAPAPEGEESDQ